MKVNLMDVIDAMEMINDDETYYYNTQNEEIVYELNEDDDYDFYIPLPTKYQINEYRIMSDFVRTIEDDNKRSWFENAIHGRGAFRFFRATL